MEKEHKLYLLKSRALKWSSITHTPPWLDLNKMVSLDSLKDGKEQRYWPVWPLWVLGYWFPDWSFSCQCSCHWFTPKPSSFCENFSFLVLCLYSPNDLLTASVLFFLVSVQCCYYNSELYREKKFKRIVDEVILNSLWPDLAMVRCSMWSWHCKCFGFERQLLQRA